MGLIDDLKKWAHPYEDEDEEYEDDFAELGSRDTGAFADERPSRRERDRDEDRRSEENDKEGRSRGWCRKARKKDGGKEDRDHEKGGR